MNPPPPTGFDANAANYKVSEVHRSSPTIDRLKAMFPRVESVCDVASGAGHTGLAFGGTASRIVAVDPAPNMLEQVRQLSAERGLAVEAIAGYAESIPLPSAEFDLVVCRLAAHHFSDVARAVVEMARLARPGGHVAVIDLEGDDDPAIDAVNHDIEMLHDPTHVRAYPVSRWRQIFEQCGLAITACENRQREIPAGLTVARWCQISRSGAQASAAIRNRLSATPASTLAALYITPDSEGEFRLAIRTLLIVGRKSAGEMNSSRQDPRR